MAIHSSILAWRIHGQRSLAGYSPQSRKESDTTEATEHAHTLHHREVGKSTWAPRACPVSQMFPFCPRAWKVAGRGLVLWALI